MARGDNSFMMVQNLINLDSGTLDYRDSDRIYLCEATGSLRITFTDESTETVSTRLGTAYSFEYDRGDPLSGSSPHGATSIEILSGKFHVGY